MNTKLAELFSLAGLLAFVNLEFLRPVLLAYYGQTWRWKKFDCVAMLKLTIFRIVKRKDRCAVIRYLKLFPEQAKLLGFIDGLPSPKTVWHWEKIRIGTAGFRKIFDETVWNIKMLLKVVGIVLGAIVCVDSTPLIACREDKDPLAVFNPHYFKFMYKADTSTCGETGIPVDYGHNGGVAYDGHQLPGIVDRIVDLLKTLPNIFVGDCHYNTFDNHILAYQKGFRLVGSFEENHVLDPLGTTEALMEEYKKHWQDREYVRPPLNFLQVLRFLVRVKPEMVGRYFKNQAFISKDTDEYKKIKGKRNHEESLHSALKEHQGFEHLHELGATSAELHIAMHHIALLVTSPLALLQQGETKNLMRLTHYES